MDIKEKMLECEKAREFDKHINEPNYDNVIEVDENFPYIKKGFRMKFRIFFDNLLVIRPYSFYLSVFKHKTKIIGKENLKEIKNAIFTCNHVDIFDCLIVKRALRRKLKIVAASFNNQKGSLGGWMRSGGMLPLSDNIGGMRKFNEAIKYYLERKHSILIYPETAMWYHYKKPRPHKVGAYHFSVKYNLPVIPLYITFKENGNFVLHIMKPIYPNSTLDKKEASTDLMEKNMEAYKNKYEEFYGIELKYAD